MPFVGEISGDRVIPEEVPDGTDVACPACGEKLRPRGPFRDGTARHFYHTSNFGTCSGGESETHRKLKSLAVSALRNQFNDIAEKIRPEVAIDVSETPTQVDQRRADALVQFRSRHQRYGQGLAIEVQYQNNQKDIRGVTHDYLTNDLSVFWADQRNFQEDVFQISDLINAFDSGTSSTNAFAAPRDPAPPVVDHGDQGKLSHSGSEKEGEYNRWTPIDPNPACRHEIIKRGVFDLCIRCGLKVEDRVYIEQADRYERKKELGLLGNFTMEYVADRRSLQEDNIDFNVIDRGESPSNHAHNWRKRSDNWGYEKHQCSCGSTLVVKEDEIIIDHSLSGEDSCQHEWEVKTTSKVCTKCGEERKPWDE
ncbi:hypothetical protein [Halovenus sp. HT40]|uniref:hypothetical protein n=1 Tax=Halovenus sp. HT40 TaxID=3126691 RepID=UPI00300EEF2A